MTSYEVPDEPKMLRETLAAAQHAINQSVFNASRREEHSARLQRLINECDRHRPVGIDGNHGNLHTETCGCLDKGPQETWGTVKPYDGLVHVKVRYENRSLCGEPCPYWRYAGTRDQVTCEHCRFLVNSGCFVQWMIHV